MVTFSAAEMRVAVEKMQQKHAIQWEKHSIKF
jgi:hypothetical protein